MGDGQDERTAGHLAEEWRALRTSILELAHTIPETRVSRVTERAGWTMKHELAHLAALDAEVIHLVRTAGQQAADRLDPVALRRLRGQAMHQALEMRLTPLREHLAEAGERAARALEEAAVAVADAVELDRIRERLERARAGEETLRGTLGG